MRLPVLHDSSLHHVPHPSALKRRPQPRRGGARPQAPHEHRRGVSRPSHAPLFLSLLFFLFLFLLFFLLVVVFALLDAFPGSSSSRGSRGGWGGRYVFFLCRTYRTAVPPPLLLYPASWRTPRGDAGRRCWGGALSLLGLVANFISVVVRRPTPLRAGASGCPCGTALAMSVCLLVSMLIPIPAVIAPGGGRGEGFSTRVGFFFDVALLLLLLLLTSRRLTDCTRV